MSRLIALLLFFTFFTEGVIFAQIPERNIVLDTSFAIPESEQNSENVENPEDYNAEMNDEPYVAPYAEAQKKYTAEAVESRAVAHEDWKKATKDIDFSDDTEKEVKKKQNANDFNPAVFAVLIEFLKWFFIVGAILLLGYLIYRFVGEGNIFSGKSRRLATASMEIDMDEIEENLETTELDPLIRKAIDAKNFPLATRLYYLAILKELTLKNAIAWKRDKTNRTYISEMRPNRLFESFRSVTAIFERVWYGDSVLDETIFGEIQPAFHNLLMQSKT